MDSFNPDCEGVIAMADKNCMDTMPGFAGNWIAAWNARDVERVLSHYSDQARLTSPAVVRVLGRPDGTVRGRDELAEYFRKGLAAAPDLRLELMAEARGVGTTTLVYRLGDRLVCETARFDGGGRIVEAVVHYAESGRRDGPAEWLRRVLDAVLDWMERSASRRRLAALDDRMLRDIGVSRCEAEEEARKPFWRYY